MWAPPAPPDRAGRRPGPRRSRFTGGEDFLAGYYELLWPHAKPHEVRAMTAAEVAAVMGWHRVETVVVRPLTDADLAAWVPPQDRVRRGRDG